MRTGAWRTALAVLLAGALGPAAGAASQSFPDLPRLAEATTSEPDPARIRVQHLGISTLLFDDGETRILVDGFISRPGRLALLFGFKPDEEKIDGALQAMTGGKTVAAVLVAHAHYDHAMDARYIAWKHGAKLVGSRSVAMIGDPKGRPAPDTWVPAAGETITCGRFKVTVRQGPHSDHNLASGEIETTLTPPARGRSYKASDSYAFLIENEGRKILVQPSANLADPAPANPNADIVFLSIGMLGRRDARFAGDYWKALVGKGARQVVLIHWDDPTRPAADREPAPIPDRIETGLKLIKAQDTGGRLRTLPIGKPVDLDLPPRATKPANAPGVCSRSGPAPA